MNNLQTERCQIHTRILQQKIKTVVIFYWNIRRKNIVEPSAIRCRQILARNKR